MVLVLYVLNWMVLLREMGGSRLGVDKTFKTFCLWRVVRFNVFANPSLAQFVNVSPRLVGPYNTGAGVNDV